MFFGSYECNLDEKNRLCIPSKFKDSVGSKLYLLKGFDGCISLYKENDFEAYIKKLETLEFERKVVRSTSRLILSSIVEMSLDKQGRMLIPTKTAKEYGINKEVILIGQINHFEIWDKLAWEKYKEANNSNFEDNAESILTYEK